MPQKTADKILLDSFKLDPEFLKSSVKIKRLCVTEDGDIVDNSEMTTQYVNGVLSYRNTKVKNWFSTTRPTCEFSIEIYHPDNDEKFIEIVSNCVQTYSTIGSPHYQDYVIVYKSTDESINEKLFRLDITELLLIYLKSNGLIGRVNYRIS